MTHNFLPKYIFKSIEDVSSHKTLYWSGHGSVSTNSLQAGRKQQLGTMSKGINTLWYIHSRQTKERRLSSHSHPPSAGSECHSFAFDLYEFACSRQPIKYRFIQCVASCVWLCVRVSGFCHLAYCFKVHSEYTIHKYYIPFYYWRILHCIDISHFIYECLLRNTPQFGTYKKCCYVHVCTCFVWSYAFIFVMVCKFFKGCRNFSKLENSNSLGCWDVSVG